MTFEEFFKKKKIDIELLKAAEPSLFAEFELHFSLMGEKSFDHTKKYLFNPLRHKYHTPEEVKVEKVVIENQLAEQTITEFLSEQTEAAPAKVGFKPRFKAPGSDPAPALSEEKTEAPSTEIPAAKVGFKPRFNAAAVAGKPTEETPAIPEENVESSAEAPMPKVGFKPRFNAAAMAKPKDETPVISKEKVEADAEAPASVEVKTEAEIPAPKLGFKPKFKSAAAPIANEDTSATAEEKADPPATELTPAKLGFKPKFKSAAAPKINTDDNALSDGNNEA